MNYLKEAALEIKKVRTLTSAAVATAVTVVLDFFRLVLTPTMEISFSFLGVALAGMMYGPIVGGIVGGISDYIEYLIRPSGAFFFGFTFNKIVSGFIYGLFLYKKQPTIKRTAMAVLVETVIVTLILTPLWLNIMYGSSLFVIERLVEAVILFPINTFLLYKISKVASDIILKRGTV